MRLNILFKTFIVMIVSFSLVFIVNLYISYQRFSSLYIEENIESVKTSILASIELIQNDVDLSDTPLQTLSSETSFIRFTDNMLIEKLGPDYLEEADVIPFVSNIYDSEEAVTEDNLIYHIELIDDIYHINYIYQFDIGDYLIISTRVQSLQNVDNVLIRINQTQSIFLFIVIAILSMIISFNISRPIKKINAYAKDISNLNFKQTLNIKRHDEFEDLVTSLNEMTFNLKKAYQELSFANQQLKHDIDIEKEQDEKKKELTMMINHEVKTPLAVMKGMIEGMLDNVGRYKDRDKYLNELLKQIETIEHITRDLTYSLKLEDKVVSEACVHTSLVSKQIDDIQSFIKQHHVKVHQNIASCDIHISEDLFIILVTNLVKNAILYTADNNIYIKGEIIDSHYVFTVRNKGEIPESEITHIFDPFYRLNQNNKNERGTGLGLYIVKQIVDLYGYTYKLFNDSGDVVTKIQFDVKK